MSESVYEMSPEDAMLRLWIVAKEWWWDTRDKIWEGKLPGPSWRWFYDAVERLERDPLATPKKIVETTENILALSRQVSSCLVM